MCDSRLLKKIVTTQPNRTRMTLIFTDFLKTMIDVIIIGLSALIKIREISVIRVIRVLFGISQAE